jgi:hypothetical protein
MAKAKNEKPLIAKAQRAQRYGQKNLEPQRTQRKKKKNFSVFLRASVVERSLSFSLIATC